MQVRVSKSLLVLAVALFYTLVVLNNTTDYDSNFQFVRHVMQMDTTFAGNRGMWRAINQSWIHTVFYGSIIAWEAVTGLLCWWAGWTMLRAVSGTQERFERAKRLGVVGLTLGMLMWMVVFLCVGGEWFLMWQSKAWNGQEVGFRMFMVLGLVLVYLTMSERESE